MLVHDLHIARAGRDNVREGMGGKLLADWWGLGVEQMEATLAARSTPGATPPRGKHRLRLALMQGVPEKWALEKNFATFLERLDQADGADIFITPECWLDGYAAPDPASTPEKLRQAAQDPAHSPYLARVAKEAREREMYICFGFTSLEGGHIYNAAGLWDDKGELAGIYHKTHLQTHDLQYAPGTALPVWETRWGKVGMMICADRRWPETARTLRLQGARLILNPTYGMHHLDNEWWMRTRGYENQCFIAFAHPQAGFVVDPKGNLSAKLVDTPGVLLCDIDLVRATGDNHIRDRRPEIYGAITE
jgi:predicted amidohydrolase